MEKKFLAGGDIGVGVRKEEMKVEWQRDKYVMDTELQGSFIWSVAKYTFRDYTPVS